MQIEIGKNYGGVFGVRMARLVKDDIWYFEREMGNLEAANAAWEKFTDAGGFALISEEAGGVYLCVTICAPQMTAAVVKSLGTSGTGTRAGL